MENLLLVQPADFGGQKRKFLRFETLTQVPFDRALIDADLLAPDAIVWLNAYHAALRGMLEPHLDAINDSETLAWLAAATAPI
jgi:Xaa-Pro aminopeptidase